MGYSHGTKWSDKLIEKKLYEVINGAGLDHFPTHSEMEDFFGDRSLAVALSKNGGTNLWAEKLKLPLKDSETVFGNTYELQAIEDIKVNTGLDSVYTNPRYPYDLLVDRGIKVDVKSANPFRDEEFMTSWTFNLEKKLQTCDIYIFYCIHFEKVVKVLIVPSITLSGQTQFGVGDMSKWDCYKNRWDIITDYANFLAKYKEQPKRLSYVSARYHD